MPKVNMVGYKCERCGHAWMPRKKSTPKWCPSCKSPYWNRPRIRGVK